MTLTRRMIATSLVAISLAAASTAPAAAGPQREWRSAQVRIDADPEHGIVPVNRTPERGESRSAFDARTSRPELSLDEALAELRRNLQTHDYRPPTGAQPGAVGGSLLADEDWITKEQCLAQWNVPGFRGPWHYRNHYSACQRFYFTINNQRCTSSGCTQVGTTKVRAVVLGKGYSGDRALYWDVYLDDWSGTGEQQDATTQLNINVRCQPYPGEVTACNSDQASGTTRSVAEWKATPFLYLHTFPATNGPTPGDAYPGEKRGHFQYTPVLSTPLSGQTSESRWTIGRCDNATYINGTGCMFPGTAGILHFDYNDPTYSQSSRFIWKAMHRITTTKPGAVGTYVPGGYYAQPNGGYYEPLTRNYYNPGTRTKVQNTCKQYWGDGYATGPNGEQRECDEYPFSATHQSANFDEPGTAATYAVEVISSAHNGKAGSVFSTFLRADHILEDDPFFVAIDNAPNP